jgi:uncharacterized protein (TIGR02996 family)
MSDDADFLRAILDEPDDDGPRLVYADYLDLDGDPPQPEMAELIRVQCDIARLIALGAHEGETCNVTGPCGDCHREGAVFRLRERELDLLNWFATEDMAVFFGLPNHSTLHATTKGLTCIGLGVELYMTRGFVAEVRAPLAALVGGECERCDVAPGVRRYATHSGDWIEDDCNECGGTGRTPGILRRLVREQPVERVVATDREPAHEAELGEWFWSDERSGETGSHVLPHDLFESVRVANGEYAGVVATGFDSPASAHDFLSAALLRWAAAPHAATA